MKQPPIGVGIIGASPGPGWATRAHLPALAALPAFRIVAVSTTKQASADATARAFGVPHAFDNAAALVEHPDVELVVISVRPPAHGALVRAALAARKHVYCEWPVGPTLAETTALAALARDAGVHAVAGLQGRLAPGFRQLRQLVADGYLGTLRSVHVHGALPILGARRQLAWAPTADIKTGANALHTVTPHLLDPVLSTFGLPTSLSALVAQQFTTTTLIETGETIPVTVPDQIAVIGTLPGGAVLSVRIEAGKRSGAVLAWTLTGTEGDLELGGDFSLRGARGDGQPLAPIATPDDPAWPARGELSDDAHRVAHVYAALGRALRGGTLDPRVVTFDEAVRIRQMLEAIVRSSTEGRRVAIGS